MTSTRRKVLLRLAIIVPVLIHTGVGAWYGTNKLVARQLSLIHLVEIGDVEGVDYVCRWDANQVRQPAEIEHTRNLANRSGAVWVKETVAPIFVAVMQNNPEMLRCLIRYGADVHVKLGNGAEKEYVSQPNFTPFLFLAHLSKPEKRIAAAQVLLDAGVDINTEDGYGGTALNNAVSQERDAFALFLLEAGADPNFQAGPYIDDVGKSAPLHTVYDRVELVGPLLAHGADIEARDGWGHTPLHAAVAAGAAQTVQALLDAGARVNAVGDRGNTTLHLAMCRPLVVAQLLAAGANPNLRDEEGNTPLHVEFMYKPLSLRLLLEAGADPGIRNNAGKTPADTIMAEEAKEMLRNWKPVRAPKEVLVPVDRKVVDRGEPVEIRDLGIVLQPVPAGRFVMGARLSAVKNALMVMAAWDPTMSAEDCFEAYVAESPRRSVTVRQRFWMGSHEITQRQWALVMGTELPKSGNDPFVGDQLPVLSATWDQAVGFCDRLTERERKAGRLPKGLVYRLPTEAEWEYACRAGTNGIFHFGNSPDKMHEYGNYHDSSADQPPVYQAGRRDGHEYISPVGSFKPNAWGLYDMHGNVSEWCLDRFGPYVGRGVSNPLQLPKVSARVSRGGSWTAPIANCRAATRKAVQPNVDGFDQGLRIVLASPANGAWRGHPVPPPDPKAEESDAWGTQEDTKTGTPRNQNSSSWGDDDDAWGDDDDE